MTQNPLRKIKEKGKEKQASSFEMTGDMIMLMSQPGGSPSIDERRVLKGFFSSHESQHGIHLLAVRLQNIHTGGLHKTCVVGSFQTLWRAAGKVSAAFCLCKWHLLALSLHCCELPLLHMPACTHTSFLSPSILTETRYT